MGGKRTSQRWLMLHGTLNNIDHLLRSRSNHEREAAMPRFGAVLVPALIAALAAQPALAQINEADRLARCQNNREAYARQRNRRDPQRRGG